MNRLEIWSIRKFIKAIWHNQIICHNNPHHYVHIAPSDALIKYHAIFSCNLTVIQYVVPKWVLLVIFHHTNCKAIIIVYKKVQPVRLRVISLVRKTSNLIKQILTTASFVPKNSAGHSFQNCFDTIMVSETQICFTLFLVLSQLMMSCNCFEK